MDSDDQADPSPRDPVGAEGLPGPLVEAKVSDLHLPSAPRRRVVSWRAVMLGLLGAIIMCGLTPYNDYALNNTFLIGNNLPLGVVTLIFLFLIFVNGPLNKWRPQWAWTGGELAVAFSMTLVACALPSSGLMRYFPPALIGPLWHARAYAGKLKALSELDLPGWLFPNFSTGDTPYEWIFDPVVDGYMTRWSGPGPLPFVAWIQPALVWGVFIFAFYGALMAMVTIVRRQWFENERLAFPLAQIQLALLEGPAPRKALNRLMSYRSFWVAFAGIFTLQVWNGLAVYFPSHFPTIWVYYDLNRIFADAPWSYIDGTVKSAAIFFSAVGVSYFLSGSIAFSLWATFLLVQFYKMGKGVATGDGSYPDRYDQHFGAVVAFSMTAFWIGRQHWWMVLKQALRGAKPGEPRGRYFSYAFAFWTLILCTIIMICWLIFAGASVLAASVCVILLLTLFFVITRIVAETGLVYSELQVWLHRPWEMAVWAGWKFPITSKDMFLTATVDQIYFDTREVMSVYATHGMKVADETAFNGKEDSDDADADRRTGRKFILALMLALFVGYFVSLGSTLWVEYTYAWTKDTTQKRVNEWGAEIHSRQSLDAVFYYNKQNYPTPYNPFARWAVGAGITTALTYLRLRFEWWPLHPIGFVLYAPAPMSRLWFSIFLGWLARALIVRFGGSKLYTDAKPFFIGLIVGEGIAAGAWAIVGLILSGMGEQFRVVNIMPG